MEGFLRKENKMDGEKVPNHIKYAPVFDEDGKEVVVPENLPGKVLSNMLTKKDMDYIAESSPANDYMPPDVETKEDKTLAERDNIQLLSEDEIYKIDLKKYGWKVAEEMKKDRRFDS